MTSPGRAGPRVGVTLFLLVAAVALGAIMWAILRAAGDRSAFGHAVLILVVVVLAATSAGLLVRRSR